jgi:hypothetical protein
MAAAKAARAEVTTSLMEKSRKQKAEQDAQRAATLSAGAGTGNDLVAVGGGAREGDEFQVGIQAYAPGTPAFTREYIVPFAASDAAAALPAALAEAAAGVAAAALGPTGPAPAPPCAAPLLMRFQRAIPDTVLNFRTAGAYRDDGNTVVGAKRRRMLALIFAERYALAQASTQRKRLLEAMVAALVDEERVVQSAGLRNLPVYRKTMMRFLKAMRKKDNATLEKLLPEDSFDELRKSMRAARKTGRNGMVAAMIDVANRLGVLSVEASTVSARSGSSSGNNNFLDASTSLQRNSLKRLVKTKGELKFLVKVSSLALEHEMFTMCCAEHKGAPDGITRDEAFTASYESQMARATRVLQRGVMKNVKGRKVLIEIGEDAMRGSVGMRDILEAAERDLGRMEEGEIPEL